MSSHRRKILVPQMSLLDGEVCSPLTVSYGMGVDSTAMLIGMAQMSMRPDLILFADTGAEKRETYAFEPIMQRWLEKEGFPSITTVRYIPSDFKNWPPYYSLPANLLTNGTLPSISFGFSSCSLKWKKAPQDKYISTWEPAIRAWRNGIRVKKCIGYDNSPRDRKRTFAANPQDTNIYEYLTPLIEWGWDREECKRQIRRVGLPVSPKSSCFMCAAMKPHEVDELPPEDLRMIVKIEARAHPRLRNCEGLWRTAVKGTRGGTPRPGSMTQYIREKGLLPVEEIDHIWSTTPKEITSFQEGYARARAEGRLEDFLSSGVPDYRERIDLDQAA